MKDQIESQKVTDNREQENQRQDGKIIELEAEVNRLKEKLHLQETESQDSIMILREENKKLQKSSKQIPVQPTISRASTINDREATKLSVENEILKK